MINNNLIRNTQSQSKTQLLSDSDQVRISEQANCAYPSDYKRVFILNIPDIIFVSSLHIMFFKIISMQMAQRWQKRNCCQTPTKSVSRNMQTCREKSGGHNCAYQSDCKAYTKIPNTIFVPRILMAPLYQTAIIEILTFSLWEYKI